MSQLFRIGPPRESKAKARCRIEAAHPIALPGVRCPSCGSWATTGVSYPTVDERTVNDVIPNDPSPIAPDELAKVIGVLSERLGPGRPLYAGSQFGPLRGHVRGSCGDFDFVWPNPWTVLIRESAFLQLRDSGAILAGRQAELESEDGPQEPLVELEAPPTLRLDASLLPEACPICGRTLIAVPDRILVSASSINDSVPLQRIAELPTVLLVSEACAERIRAASFTGVEMSRVESAVVEGN